MRISKHIQRVLAVMLCLLLAVAPLAVNPARAQAAEAKTIEAKTTDAKTADAKIADAQAAEAKTTGTKTEKLTLYAGENKVIYNAGDMVYAEKVSSSNKKVVTVEPESSLSYKVLLTPKKAGKATITIETAKKGTLKLKVTVKKPDFDTDLLKTEDGIIVTSKNNNKQYFKTNVKTTLRDEAGEVLMEKTIGMYQLPGKTDYICYGPSKSVLERIDLKKSTVEVTRFHRFVLGDDTQPSDLSYVYKDVSKKIESSSSVKVTRETRNQYLGEWDYYKVKIKNPQKREVHVTIYILCYDAEGKLFKVKSKTIIGGVKAGKSETVEIDVFPNYDSYKVLIHAYERYKE